MTTVLPACLSTGWHTAAAFTICVITPQKAFMEDLERTTLESGKNDRVCLKGVGVFSGGLMAIWLCL